MASTGDPSAIPLPGGQTQARSSLPSLINHYALARHLHDACWHRVGGARPVDGCVFLGEGEGGMQGRRTAG